MEKSVFNEFREIVYNKSGISLKDGKEALVSARVSKRMRALGIHGHRAYLRFVKEDESGEEVVNLLDVISTNVTNFFREPGHFDFLSEAVKEWLNRGQRRFRFWSAACSTGEEPYSMAMALKDVSIGYDADIKILATDISTRVIQNCLAGSYTKSRVQDIPKYLLHRYFVVNFNGEVRYSVKSELRNMIVFRRLNLSEPPFPMNGPLDVIFCRNVMIYFDNDICKKLLADLYRLLKPKGYLMVGHAESLTGMVSDFKVVRPSIFTKPA